ncbi:MAG: ATP-binding cassette domain-containing protein [Tissierellia bacterium]|nr:ATP-binding cassette domain-containing protein [Tissierellia bacterium]
MELVLNDVSKSFGEKKAVDNILLKIGLGIHGLLGANGAGKTTLMRMICGLLKPTNGEIRFNGKDVNKLGEEYLNALGYLPQDFGYYPEFTAMEYIDYIGAVKGLSKTYTLEQANELFEVFQLFEVKNKKIKTYSGGMKQRLGIIQSMLNNPRILILDEPTSGLDPKQRLIFKNYLSQISKERIVILSTHITSDLQNIANNIIMMKSGKIICTGDEEKLLKQLEGRVWEFVIHERELLKYMEKSMIISYSRKFDKIRLRVISDIPPAKDAIPLEPSLEDLYLYYNPEEIQGEEE